MMEEVVFCFCFPCDQADRALRRMNNAVKNMFHWWGSVDKGRFAIHSTGSAAHRHQPTWSPVLLMRSTTMKESLLLLVFVFERGTLSHPIGTDGSVPMFHLDVKEVNAKQQRVLASAAWGVFHWFQIIKTVTSFSSCLLIEVVIAQSLYRFIPSSLLIITPLSKYYFYPWYCLKFSYSIKQHEMIAIFEFNWI